MQTPAVLPTFMLPRASMGIVVRYFLEYTGSAASFARDIQATFPCCHQPIEDLKTAFRFWEDLRRCVDAIAQQCDAEELNEDMKNASEILYDQQARLQIPIGD